MEVDFNPGRSPITGGNQPVVRREPSATATDNTMSFDQTTSLQQSLKDSSQVRPEKVAQASALVADPGYPSDDILDRLAGLLAQHINS
jgi:hypothetical protein